MKTYFPVEMWKPADLSPVVLVIAVLLCAAFLAAFPLLLRRYMHWMKQCYFREILQSFALPGEETNLLNNLVSRYALSEPVKIFYSLPLFDELAEKEMMRVLADPYSSKSKMLYIDQLYGLRHKLYFE